MKQTFTRLLPLAAGLLLCVPASQAQVTPSISASKAPKGLPTQLQFSLPAGAPTLRHAITTLGVGPTKRLAQQRGLVRSGSKQVALAGAVQSQARTSAAETTSQVWATRYREGANSAAFTRVDMEVDAAGNTYVLGHNSSGEDYVTSKFSPSGQLVWEEYYNSPGRYGSVDRPVDLVLDAAGNVIVTGTSTVFAATSGTPTSRADFLTVKYSPSGQTLWVNRFDRESNNDVAEALAVDAAGNVYVTGTIIFAGTNPPRNADMVTVKYSANGTRLWSTAYTSNNGGPNAVAADAAGNAYVSRDRTIFKYDKATGQLVWTASNQGNIFPVLDKLMVDGAGDLLAIGYYATTTSSTNYATRKYAAATGQQLWEAVYNGPANGADEPTALAVDANNNVFVTGSSSSGAKDEFATIKYSPSGQQLWLARYNGPTGNGAQGFDNVLVDMVLDAAGNVYVAGTSQGLSTNNDYATVKYSASGQQVWEARYNGPANRADMAKHIGLDTAGNVYVGGDSGKAPDGTSFTLVKYEQNSVQEAWEARFTGTGNSAEVAKDVVSDAAGNVYVTGYAYNGRNYDYATVKYNANGQQQWEARYNGPADNEDLPTNVVVDAAGNVYVSGTSYSATESDYATIKYSPTGQQLWVKRYNGPANGYDLASKVEVDGTGNVYVTGSSDNGSTSSYDYATVKYDTNGQQQWATRYNGPANSFDLAADLVVDPAGDVYVTGTTYTDTQSDYATVRYDANGQQVWETRYNGPANGYDEAARIALANGFQSSVVVTGTSDGGTSTGFDIATSEYTRSTGQQQWVGRYNGPSNGDDVVADMVTGLRNEFAYVVGTSFSSTGADYVTMMYQMGTGRLAWTINYNGPDNSYEEAKAVAVDAAGNAYVTGLSYNSDGTDDYATVKYAVWPNANPSLQTGRQLWAARYDGTGSYDEAAAITVDASNNVYVSGYSQGTDTGYDFATLKYSQNNGGGPLALATSTASVGSISSPLAVAAPSRQLHELSVYPNPTTGPITVSFRPVQDGAAQVRVYNQLGQQVASLYEGKVRQGQHYELPLHSEKLSAGLYTCSLLVNGQRESVRLVITH
ncbi:T9SS type A sorting domain-containing protein [Hymenobacter sp. YC55]|uniref:T9SS type A sorting domain-containing protein n=1 Tax=Hymenobacter sp. YC55 TaxID=3034019 RepID=UPI0023F9793C|nr:T9SS type A sorting domain-containing protein [Hymenobacter sp. YC55]MDF7812055.1 T9SS type A sorting domain-containing protein [Hymenobacter sp. YC55]